jgi:hypothetical protein
MAATCFPVRLQAWIKVETVQCALCTQRSVRVLGLATRRNQVNLFRMTSENPRSEGLWRMHILMHTIGLHVHLTLPHREESI